MRFFKRQYKIEKKTVDGKRQYFVSTRPHSFSEWACFAVKDIESEAWKALNQLREEMNMKPIQVYLGV